MGLSSRAVRVFVMAAMLGALLIHPLSGKAAEHSVAVGSNFFSPSTIATAAADDTITWSFNACCHNVRKFTGDASAPVYSGVPGAVGSYAATFEGGTWFYRCEPHSYVSASGVCYNMCGAITDRTTAPATPSISQPAAGDVNVNPVTFGGTGDAWSHVVIYEGDLPKARALVGASGSWQVALTLVKGSHTFYAKSTHVNGLASETTATLTINVTVDPPDTTPPSVTIATPTNSIFVGRPLITGTASDNTSVDRVRVTFTSTATNTVQTFTSDCPECPSDTVTWSVRPELLPGTYTVRAVAVDTVGRSGISLAIRIYTLTGVAPV